MVRRHQARIVYYLQDIYPDVAVALGVTKNSWPIQFLRHRLKQAYLAADCIVVLDEDMRDRLVGWGLPKDRLRIVANWMDCNTVKPVKENNAFRKANGVDDRFVVMHSGNMGMTQRLEVLIDAMKRPEIQSSALLMLVGNGAKRISLEKQATEQSNVRFLDYQPRDQLAASLSAADLHVVSMDQSITGCLAPSKLYGIFASGTPVLAIVPKDNAVWRLVSQENLGWTVAPGDQAGIAKAINEAQTLSRHALTEMGLRGRALAMRLYDKQICCDAFESVLNEVSAR
jgi:glycosyltransferase involved in cell wall biosynthesis